MRPRFVPLNGGRAVIHVDGVDVPLTPKARARRSGKKICRFEKAVRCTLHLYAGGTINRRWLMEHMGVSCAQAKRDLNELERLLPVQRKDGVLTLSRSKT